MYSVPVQTSNGTTYAARLRLRNFALGPVGLNNAEALVAKPYTLAHALPLKHAFS